MKLHRLLVLTLVSLLVLPGCGGAAAKPREPDLGAYLRGYGYQMVRLEKLPSRHESVLVEINGVTGLFVLDSGAGGSVVNRASAARFGLRPDAGPALRGTGAGGAFAVGSYRADTFKLGGIALPVERIAVADLAGVVAALRIANGSEIDGVIGQDILTRFGGIIDVGGQRLFLRKSPR